MITSLTIGDVLFGLLGLLGLYAAVAAVWLGSFLGLTLAGLVLILYMLDFEMRLEQR